MIAPEEARGSPLFYGVTEVLDDNGNHFSQCRIHERTFGKNDCFLAGLNTSLFLPFFVIHGDFATSDFCTVRLSLGFGAGSSRLNEGSVDDEFRPAMLVNGRSWAGLRP